MKYFTKEQIERLKEASIHFYTAVHENFKRGTMAPLNNLVADIYFEATGEKLNPNWSCNTCCLNNFKTAGRLYFDSIRYWQDQPRPLNQVQDTQETSSTLRHTEGTDEERVDSTKSKDLPAAKNETVEKTTNHGQNTPTTIVLDDTQQVQEVQGVNNSEAVVLETEPALNINKLEKTVANKPKGRPKGSKKKK